MRLKDRVLRWANEPAEERARRKLKETQAELDRTEHTLNTTEDREYTMNFKNFLRRKIERLTRVRGQWCKVVDGFNLGSKS